MVIPEESPAAALLRKLAASEITIPWLFKLAPTWKSCMNVYEAEIETYVTDWSERYSQSCLTWKSLRLTDDYADGSKTPVKSSESRSLIRRY